MIAPAQLAEDIATLAIPGAKRETRGLRCDHAPRSEGRIVEKALVGIHLHIFRVVDSDEPQLIDVIPLFHWLDEAQTQLAIDRGETIPFDLDPLTRVGEVAPRRREPVADNRGANHIGDEAVFVAVP